jgi:hypothetical protein
MSDLFPNRKQARTLVTSVGVFWASWAVAVLYLSRLPGIGALAFAVGLVSIFRFYLTLYRVWEPDSGESAGRRMLVPSFGRRMRSAHRMFDLFRPRWIKHTLRETGWNPTFVGFVLLALLAMDLMLFFTVFPQAFATRP